MGEAGESLLPSESAGTPAVERTVRASEAAEVLGYGKRAINHWCTVGVGGDVCPSEMRTAGKLRTRYVNVDEVRAWRRRVGLEDDRQGLIYQSELPVAAAGSAVVVKSEAAAPAAIAEPKEPAKEAAGAPQSPEDVDDLDAMLAVARDMMRQLRDQVARIAQQDSDKVSPAAIANASGAVSKISQELRALDKVDRERRDRLNLVVTRTEAGSAVRSVGQVLTTGFETMAMDLPAVLRSRLVDAEAVEVKDQMVFDRIAAIVLTERCERVRHRLADELEASASEMQGVDPPRDRGGDADEREAA